MIARRLKIAGAILAVAVIGEAFYLASLRHRVQRLFQTGRTDEQIRREMTHPPVATPSDVRVEAKIFWASTVSAGTLEPVDIELPLSREPVQRAKQLINALIASAPTAEQRTLPADATLVEFYLLSDGTGVADFSDALATATPSGILSETMAVGSIVKTLAANVEQVRRLKILIHGQEMETLAGHVDLTGTFAVRPATAESPIATPAAPTAAALTH